MQTYNKLVRDRIPEIIKSKGGEFKTRILSDDEYKVELDKKLSEEIKEYQADQNMDELADLLEIIYAIAENNGVSKEELEKIRVDKAAKRGGFKDKIFLIES
ncbi:MAG: nucleoside triphosphate pyrophosphohydrolase [Patescibacteria group bacterium]|jgi:predicted house-cleaning noncanonical NTP pyrophosphatase (MazG superfamily)